MTGLALAFRQAGAKAANPRWSWSARSENGEIVVMTLWEDLIDFKSAPISYSTFGRANLLSGVMQRGNRESLQNLKWARDECAGKFRVVILRAQDPTVEPRTIKTAHYQARMIFELTELNEQTGEFRAANVGS